jgi:ABC-type transport system substrate-binding protein
VNWDASYEANAVFRKYSKTDSPPQNGGNWDDDTFDKMYQAAKREPDETKRGQMYQAAAKYLNDNVPVLYLWRQDRAIALQKNTSWKAALTPQMYTSSDLSKNA